MHTHTHTHTHTHFAGHDTVAQAVGPQRATCCPQLALPSDRTCTPAARSSWSLCLQCTHTQHSSLVQGQGAGCGTENNTSTCDVTSKSRLNQGDAERPSAADYLPLHHGFCFQFTVPEVVMVFWYLGNYIYLPASQGDAVKGTDVLLLTSTKEYVGKGIQVEITLISMLVKVSRWWY